MWSATVFLGVLGSQAAHALAYRLVTPDADDRAHLLADAGHGYLRWLPLVMGAVSVVAFIAVVVTARGAHRQPFSPWPFVGFAPALFLWQELFERRLHDGGFSASALGERSVVVGVVLQLPVALLTWLVARVLLRVAETFLARRVERPTPTVAGARGPRATPFTSSVRSTLLASGRGSRGPPIVA